MANTYQAIPIGLFSLDEAGRIVQSNPAYRHMLENKAGESGHWQDGFEAGAWERLQAQAGNPDGEDIELKSLADADGKQRSFLVKATRVKERIEGSLQDITLRVEATARLRFLADHDPLTGVFNRRGIGKAFDDANFALTGSTTMALAYVDLDRFKLINDLFGHIAGDMVLRHVCQRIAERLVAGEVLGRVGGDEFVIVFQGGAIHDAAEACRAIVAEISTVPFIEGSRAFQVKCSIGLVEVDSRYGGGRCRFPRRPGLPRSQNRA